jgi:hypothetical protein
VRIEKSFPKTRGKKTPLQKSPQSQSGNDNCPISAKNFRHSAKFLSELVFPEAPADAAAAAAAAVDEGVVDVNAIAAASPPTIGSLPSPSPPSSRAREGSTPRVVETGAGQGTKGVGRREGTRSPKTDSEGGGREVAPPP